LCAARGKASRRSSRGSAQYIACGGSATNLNRPHGNLLLGQMTTSAAPSGRPLPLRIHLLSLVIGVVLPALIVSGLLVRRVVNDNRTAIDRQLLDAARAQAAIVDRELVGTGRTV